MIHHLNSWIAFLSRKALGIIAFGLAPWFWADVLAGDVVDNRAISSGRNDVVYLAPALYSYEALPVGNGVLGATVWNEKGMSYQLNHGSFFASEDETEALFSSGRVDLQLPKEWMRGFVEERLSLHDGTVVTKFKTGQSRHQIRSWMAEGLDVLVIQIDSDEPLPDFPLRLSIWPRPPNTPEISPWLRGPPSTAAVSADDVSITTVGWSKHDAVSMTAASLEGQVKTVQNDERTVTMTVLSGNRHRLTILVASPLTTGPAVDNAAALTTARDTIAKARAMGDEALAKEHDSYWHSFWNKSELVLHSEDGFGDYLENLYDLFNYWMASSSRGQDPPKFNGGYFMVCQDDRDWGGCYWYNNTRELYWPLLSANHAELFAPLVNLYWNALPNSRSIARDVYDSNGGCFEEVLPRRTRVSSDRSGNIGTALYLTSGTEMAFQMYQYYLFTKDESFLREKAYPLLKETVTFHLNFVNRESDGLYHVYPSDPRETYHWIKDSVTDLSAMRAVLPVLIQMSEKLGVDVQDREHWKDVLAHLAPFVEDPKTNRIAAGTLLDQWPLTRFKRLEGMYPPVVRTSTKGQLFNSENVACDPIYPWNLYGLNSSPEDLGKARETFLHRPYNTLEWGIAWDSSPLWAARLGLPDEMLRSLRQYVENVQMYSSGMGSTPGGMSQRWGGVLADEPAFDSAGDMSASIPEMVLQGYNGIIRVFPSMPAKWEGQFTLAAEGGFLVSSKMNGAGVIPFVKIVSPNGGPCTVINPWQEVAVLNSSGGGKEFAPGAPISFDTQAGGTYELRPKSAPPEDDSIALTRCDGPKFPFHNGPDDTVEAYLARTKTFGMLGIARDGGNPSRNAVLRVFYPKIFTGAALDPVVYPAAQLIPTDQPSVEDDRAPHPAFHIMPTTQPPVIDGKLDDAVWKDCPMLGPLLVLGDHYLSVNQSQVKNPYMALGKHYLSVNQTQVKITYDDSNLYISAVCSGSDMDKATARPDDGSERQDVSNEESVEIYLQPTPASYWHLAANLAGARFDELVTGTQKDTSHRLNFHCATSRSANAWVVEMAIPFATLGAKPKPGEHWGFNFGRNHYLPKYSSTWAPLSQSNFDLPDEFGQLIFGAN